uniref:Uncharacterized protein n=2 Tax=Meloidogyne incognita group TaxID=654580 RepID=A0A915N5P0_MELJA
MEPPTNNNSSNFDLNSSPPCFLQSSTNSMQQTNVAQRIQVFPQTQVCEEQSCLKQVGQHSNVLQQVSTQQVSNEECLEDDDVFCDSSSTCCVEPEQRARSYTSKPGRNPRRRANTMENSSKTAMDRKRRGTARKRVEHLNKDIKHEDCYSMEAASLQDLSYPNDICHEEMPCGTNTEMVGGGVCVVGEVSFPFLRPRANSTLSVSGGNTRFSPNLETSGAVCIEDIDFPPWMEQQQMEGQQQQILNPQVSELLDRTGQMRLDGRRPPMRPTFQRNGNGALIRVNNKRHSSLIPLATSPQNNPLVVPKNEIDVEQKIIKQEAIAPPPSYQELSAVRGPQQMQNPLLIRMGEHQQQQMMTPMKMNSIPSSTSVPSQSFPVSIFTSTNGQQQMFSPDNNNFQQWNRQPPNTFPQHINPMTTNNGQIMFPGGGIMGGGENNNNNGGTSLPFDLESVNAMPVDQQAFADLDVDAVLRHELAQGGQFDLP